MSYLGTREQAMADAKAADMQIDGNETSNTSPIQKGSSEAGGAPMGTKEFSTTRSRIAWKDNPGTMRRAYPETKASK